jgi:hypothetical protein
VPAGETQRRDPSQEETKRREAPKGETQKREAPQGETKRREAPQGDTKKRAAPQGDTKKRDAPKGESGRIRKVVVRPDFKVLTTPWDEEPRRRVPVALVVIILAVGILGGAALFLWRGPKTDVTVAPAGGPSVRSGATMLRLADGLEAVLSLTNLGTEDLDDVEITAAKLGGAPTTTRLPARLGKIRRGTTSSVQLRFGSESVPAGKAAHLEYEFRYRTALLGKGTGQKGLSLMVP